MSTKITIYYNAKDGVHIYYDAGTERIHFELHYIPEFKISTGSGFSDYIGKPTFLLFLDHNLMKALPTIIKFLGKPGCYHACELDGKPCDADNQFNGAKASDHGSDATYGPRGASSPAQPGTASAGQSLTDLESKMETCLQTVDRQSNVILALEACVEEVGVLWDLHFECEDAEVELRARVVALEGRVTNLHEMDTRLAELEGQPAPQPGPSPCDFSPCVGQKCRISCDKCMTIIKEVRELDEKGWDGIIKSGMGSSKPFMLGNCKVCGKPTNRSNLIHADCEPAPQPVLVCPRCGKPFSRGHLEGAMHDYCHKWEHTEGGPYDRDDGQPRGGE